MQSLHFLFIFRSIFVYILLFFSFLFFIKNLLPNKFYSAEFGKNATMMNWYSVYCDDDDDDGGGGGDDDDGDDGDDQLLKRITSKRNNFWGISCITKSLHR